MKFYSQGGQDQYLLESFFRGRRGGSFVEIGAAPDAGNTLMFERHMDWRGLRAAGGIELADLLRQQAMTGFDYVSIGPQAPADTVAALDAALAGARVISVSRTAAAAAPAAQWLGAHGYQLHARLQHDDIYRRPETCAQARTSVICAVWHGDVQRHELLRGHMDNLARQSVPVDPIYVFDGGGSPPAWLAGQVVSVRQPLTIYQAWNVALSLVATPMVMNLNLDDRLAPDAVALLERELIRNRAAVIGADWKLCYTQAETDAVQPCMPAAQMPLVWGWPPQPGTLTRLGSGRERDTLGPATLWRMEAHVGLPRYPWRLRDGSLLRSSADYGWWKLLQANPKFRLVSLPTIIGNYHSHPGEQAEFRYGDERRLMADPGIAPY
ncbi:MAG TPA: hypothetical protein VHE37_03920 [Nevskiaceae bacterium]|nr:hypothetical protein [Nevskiaceae bacterium]